MNHDKINYCNYQSRLQEKDAIQRLSTTNETACDMLEEECKNITSFTIKYSKLADDTLKEIQADLAISLSQFTTEAFDIKTKIKKIDRVIKLRKTPKLTDED